MILDAGTGEVLQAINGDATSYCDLNDEILVCGRDNTRTVIYSADDLSYISGWNDIVKHNRILSDGNILSISDTSMRIFTSTGT